MNWKPICAYVACFLILASVLTLPASAIVLGKNEIQSDVFSGDLENVDQTVQSFELNSQESSNMAQSVENDNYELGKNWESYFADNGTVKKIVYTYDIAVPKDGKWVPLYVENSGDGLVIVSPFLTLEVTETGADYIGGAESNWGLEVNGATASIKSWSCAIEGDIWNTKVTKTASTLYGKLLITYQFKFKEKPLLYATFKADENDLNVRLSWDVAASEVTLSKRFVGYDNENNPIYIFNDEEWAVLDNRLFVSWEKSQVENVEIGSFKINFRGFTPEAGVEQVFDPEISVLSALSGNATRYWNDIGDYDQDWNEIKSYVHSYGSPTAYGDTSWWRWNWFLGGNEGTLSHQVGWFAFDTSSNGLIPSEAVVDSINLSFNYEKALYFSGLPTPNVVLIPRLTGIKFYDALSTHDFYQRGFPTSSDTLNSYYNQNKVNDIFNRLSSGNWIALFWPADFEIPASVSVSSYQSYFAQANMEVIFGAMLWNYSDITPWKQFDYWYQYLGARLSDIKLVIEYRYPGFYLDANPSSYNVAVGHSKTGDITVTSTEGFVGNVNLFVVDQPSGVSVSLNPATVALTANGTATSKMTISVSESASAGSYTFKIKGHDSSGTYNDRYTNIKLEIRKIKTMLHIYKQDQKYYVKLWAWDDEYGRQTLQNKNVRVCGYHETRYGGHGTSLLDDTTGSDGSITFYSSSDWSFELGTDSWYSAFSVVFGGDAKYGSIDSGKIFYSDLDSYSGVYITEDYNSWYNFSDTGPPIIVDGTSTGIFAGDVSSNYYNASSNAGGTLDLAMNPNSDYDLYLYDPSQNLVASSAQRGEGLTEEITYTTGVSGYYYIEVRRISGTGTYNLSVSGVTEATPPELYAIQEIWCGSTWTNWNKPCWHWRASDPESGITKYEVYRSWTGDTFFTTGDDYSTTLPDGSYYIKVRAQNGAGMWSDWSEPVYVYIDTTSVSAVDTISPYWQSELPFTITAQANDNLSGVENVALWYRYSPDNSNWGDWELYGVDHEEPWSWDFDAPEGDGYCEFCSIATDKAGNVEKVVLDNLLEIVAESTSEDIAWYTWEAEMGEWTRMDEPYHTLDIAFTTPTRLVEIRLDLNYFDLTGRVIGVWPDDWRHRLRNVTVDTNSGVATAEFDVYSHYEWGDEGGYWEAEGWSVLTATITTSMDSVVSVHSEWTYEVYDEREGRRYGNGTSEWFDFGSNNEDFDACTAAFSEDGKIIVVWTGGYGDLVSTLDLGRSVVGVEVQSWGQNNPNLFKTEATATLGLGLELGSVACGVDTAAPASSVDPISPYWQNAEAAPFEVSATAADTLSGAKDVGLWYRHSADNVHWEGWKLESVKVYVPPEESLYKVSVTIVNPTREDYAVYQGLSVQPTGKYTVYLGSVEVPAGENRTFESDSVFSSSDEIYIFLEDTINVSSEMITFDGKNVEAIITLNYADGVWGAEFTSLTRKSPGTDNTGPWEFTAPDGGGYYEFYSIARDVAGNEEVPPASADARCAIFNTPVGTDVTVTATDANTGEKTNVSLTYSEVTGAGTSTVAVVDGVPPAGFQLLGTCYDITTTATYAGDITVAIRYDDSGLTEQLERALQLMHFADGEWANITVSVDTTNNIIYGETAGLSMFAVIFDNIPPESLVDAILPYWQSGAPFTVTAQASDNQSGVEHAGLWYRYSPDNVTWSNWTLFGTDSDGLDGWSWQFTAPSGEGRYEFYSAAMDAAGNAEQPEQAFVSVFADEFSGASLNTAIWSTGKVGVTLDNIGVSDGKLAMTARAAKSGTYGANYAVSNSTFDFSQGVMFEVQMSVPTDNAPADFRSEFYLTPTFTTASNPHDQPNWLRVSACANRQGVTWMLQRRINGGGGVGTLGEGEEIIEFENEELIDLLHMYTSGPTHKLSGTWRIEINSENIAVWLDDNLVEPIRPHGMSFTSAYAYLCERTNVAPVYTVTFDYVKMKVLEPAADAGAGLDTAPPGITITSPLEGAQYIAKRDNIKIDFNVTDTLDPSPTVSAYLTDVEDGTRVDVMSGQSIDPLSIDDGFWTMTVEAVDRAGNSSSLTTGQFEVIHDVQPPRTSISVGAPQYSGDQFYVTSATSFSVTAVDDLVEVGDGDGLGVALTEYLIDNGFWTTYGSPFTVSGDGPHTIYFRSTDVVGNAEETKSLAVVVDDTPPESSVVAPYPYWSDAVPFAVSADVSDALSGVASAELYYRSSTDGASWTEWKSFGADDTAPYEWSFTAPDGCAVYEFYSAAADVLGNVESAPERADASCGTAISATVDIDPDTLNLKSNGRWITAYIELPSGYDLTSVNIGTITLENVVPAEPRPTAIGDHDHDGISDLMVKFDRSAVQALVSVGDVKLTVTGKWHAVLFSGSDNIRVINPGQKQGNDNKPGQSDGHQGCGNQGGHGNGDQGNNGQCGDHGSSESHGQDNQGDQCNGQGHGNQDNQCDQGQSHGSQGGQGDQENGLPPQTPPGQNDQGNQGQGNQGDQGNEQGSSGGQSSDNQSPAGTPQEQGGSQGPSGQDNQAQSGQCSQTPPEQDGQSSGQSDQGNQGGNEGNGQGNSGNQNGQGGTPPGQSGGQGQGKGKNK